MSLQLKVCHDVWGTWSVHGLSPVPVSDLPSLSASIDYACKGCDAAPATIELTVVVHHEREWPRSRFARERCETTSAVAGADLGSPPLIRR